MADALVLGNIVFRDYSPPERQMFGGQMAMVIHKLPGGTRVIDELGPDEADIAWHGFFFDDAALDICASLDALRASGNVVSLTFAGMHRSVIVKEFIARIAREPNWVEYEIVCTVTQNASLGALGAVVSTIDSLVGSDLSTALAIL